MTIDINGFCDARFASVREAFAANFEEGLEVGAATAVTLHGETVVDLWAGYRDRARSRPWEQDTLVVVYSTSKAAVIACILKLVDDGQVALDAPVAHYWPAFGQAGKSAITVRQVLTHQAGMPGFTEVQPFAALHDWDYITDVLARQAPWHEPGSQSCYHAFTFGFILGEVLRQVTGVMLSEYFRREFAVPAGLDFHLGLKDPALAARLAELVLPENLRPAPLEGISKRIRESVEEGNWTSRERRAAEIPAANGYANARSVARLAAIFAMNGELDGRRYLSEAIVDEARTEQSFGMCPPIGIVRFGLGFGLHSDGFSAPTPTSFHWGGAGGSSILMDTKTGVGFGYTPNNFVARVATTDDEPRLERLWAALGACMDAL